MLHTVGRVVGTSALMMFVCLHSSAKAQQATTGRQAITPKEFPNSGLPYSPGILAGNTLYISGQLGRDPATAKLVPGGIEAETRQAMANIRKVLQAAGMDFKNVVSVNAFITSFADFDKFNAIYKTYFPVDPPARATVQVAGLNLGAHLEIQMIATK
jgi:2-iminobutanoate/2-iminopropanoate deaminase